MGALGVVYSQSFLFYLCLVNFFLLQQRVYKTAVCQAKTFLIELGVGDEIFFVGIFCALNKLLIRRYNWRIKYIFGRLYWKLKLLNFPVFEVLVVFIVELNFIYLYGTFRLLLSFHKDTLIIK